MRLSVEPAVSCHKCTQCKMGRENTCLNLKFLGTPGQVSGCLCEYIVMPEDCCLPTKGALTLEQAALCEPFTIGVYTIKQSRLTKGNKIAILGSGPIGLSCLVAAKVQEAEAIYATDKLDYRVDCAKRRGQAGRAILTKKTLLNQSCKSSPRRRYRLRMRRPTGNR